jgi:PhnB protein
MHANVRIGDTQVMASDGCSDEPVTFRGFSLSLAVTSEAQADRYFNALADGGKVDMALSKTFWSARFGMVTDRFGVAWMIGVFDDKTESA